MQSVNVSGVFQRRAFGFAPAVLFAVDFEIALNKWALKCLVRLVKTKPTAMDGEGT
jgi:hypothetical protein